MISWKDSTGAHEEDPKWYSPAELDQHATPDTRSKIDVFERYLCRLKATYTTYKQDEKLVGAAKILIIYQSKYGELFHLTRSCVYQLPWL
jgi:hypothetical protein